MLGRDDNKPTRVSGGTGATREAGDTKQELRRALLVAWLVGLLLSGVDVARAAAETDTWLSTQSLLVSSVFAASTVTSLCLGWVWLRLSLRRLCGARGAWLSAMPGVFDGAVIATCALATPTTSLGGPRIVYVALGMPLGFALWSVWRDRWPWLRLVVGVVGSVVCGWIVWRMPDRGRDWLRCGADLSLLVVASDGLAPLLASRLMSPVVGVVRRVGTPVVVGGVVLALAGQVLVRRSEPLRRLIQERNLHTLALARPLEAAFDPDGDGASWLHGGNDCAPFDSGVSPMRSERVGDGIDQNCDGQDGAPRPVATSPVSSVSGVAAGADVLVVSLDALRWDLVSELPQTRAALGAHARMSLATSPAPKTTQTFGVLWRGRVVRGVDFEPREYRTLPADAPKTLAHTAVAAGYRAVMIPTHRYLAPETRIGDGFEMIVPPVFHRVRDLSARDGGLVRAPEAFAEVLNVAAEDTSRPLLAWVHVLESHDPFFWEGGMGPANLEGQRHAVRDLDGKVAALIREVRRARGRPLVVAIFGDHGEEHGEHGANFHATSVHAEQVRVGFLLAGPGIPQRRVQAPVSIVQLAPTLAELLGLRPPDTFTEASLLACIVDDRGCPTIVASELESECLVGYTTEHYRYIHDASHGIERLYDHRSDPYEQHDIAAEHPADLAVVRELAQAWNESH